MYVDVLSEYEHRRNLQEDCCFKVVFVEISLSYILIGTWSYKTFKIVCSCE
jgi:hypothetical protein